MKKVLSFCCSGPRHRTVLPVIKAGKRSMIPPKKYPYNWKVSIFIMMPK